MPEKLTSNLLLIAKGVELKLTRLVFTYYCLSVFSAICRNVNGSSCVRTPQINMRVEPRVFRLVRLAGVCGAGRVCEARSMTCRILAPNCAFHFQIVDHRHKSREIDLIKENSNPYLIHLLDTIS